MSNQQVYMDHAATTPIRDEVFQKMVPFLKNNFGNPSSMYQIGQTSRKALDESREKVAKVLTVNALKLFSQVVAPNLIIPL